MNRDNRMAILDTDLAKIPLIAKHIISNQDGSLYTISPYNTHPVIVLDNCATDIRDYYKENNPFDILYNTIKTVIFYCREEYSDRCTVVAYLACHTSEEDRWSLIYKYLKHFTLQAEYSSAMKYGVELLNLAYKKRDEYISPCTHFDTLNKIEVLRGLLSIAPNIAHDLQNELEVKHWIDTMNSQTI